MNLHRSLTDKKLSVSLFETGEEKEEKKSEKDNLKEKTEAIQHLLVNQSDVSLTNPADFFDVSFNPILPLHFFAVPTPPP